MEKLKIRLPKAVEFIIHRLNGKGFRADIVGGPVRDHLRGKNPEDYDVTTNALPEQVKEVFFDVRVIETGIKHGTLTLLIDGVGYEVTTYRIDGEYKDARHPESVEFTDSLREDLARRDFTMNAIAYNPEDGITDPFGGERDIKEKTIRSVGDPEKRFSEDALRVLRGIRFASTLGFRVENNTRVGIFSKKGLLSKVSAERIYTEWKKLLSGDNALPVFDEYREVVREFLPEIADSPLPNSDRFYSSDYLARMLGLFALSNKTGDDFYLAMKRLRTDSLTAEIGRAALDALDMFEIKATSDIGKLLNTLGEQRALILARLSILVGKFDTSSVLRINEYVASGKPYKLSQLAICGEDLKKIGMSGKEIGNTLQKLMTKVIEAECENTKASLLALAKSNYNG